MAGREITQKVIDFQFSRIQMKDESQHQFYDQKYEMVRFSEWNLNNIIHGLGLVQKNHYTVKWVGFDDNSYLDAFVYCLFKGCRNGVAGQNGVFIKLKYHIYQLSARFLKIGDQKAIVQALCAAQYAKNLPQFLNKNRVIYNLFDKLLKSYLDSIKAQYQSQFQDLKIFSEAFNFFKFQIINECIGLFQHYGQKFFIICEKGCYFIVQVEPEKNNLIQLKKIVQFQDQSEHELKISNQNLLKRALEQQSKVNEIKIFDEPRKLLQYSAPQFILNGGVIKKKQQRKARYTQMEIQDQNHKNTYSNNKTKIIDPGLASRAERIKNQKQENFKINLQSTTLADNPQGSKKSKSKQKSRKLRTYYKSITRRGKTGFIETSENKRRDTNSKSKHKSNDITFDEKQARKSNVKKIQLNLKKLIWNKNQRGSHKILPKLQPTSTTIISDNNISSLKQISSAKSINGIHRQKIYTNYYKI